ncbi:MAG TPA: DUF5666 domain-containing protein [Burkholderiaceae bacterium]|nr:DUF5666 domain-containing protein [Burkholderiaceae bacterium]
MAWAGLLGAALLAGCGGNDSDTAAPAAPASVSAGTVTGFTSSAVIVNGMQYDKSAAKVLDDDDNAVAASALKLGMQVEIQCTEVNRVRGVGRAGSIAFGAAVVGPVDSVDAANNQVKVLGQTVQVSEGTVFGADISGGLAAVTAGQILAVHGLLDAASGVTTATRVDLKASVNFFRLRGVVSELNATAKTLRIGGQLVSLAKVSEGQLQKAALADGQVVRAVLETAQANGQFAARSIKQDRRFVADGNAVDILGIVTQFTSATSFKLFGLPVDASKAAFVNQADLKRGALVEVKGALAAGVLAATDVEVKQRGQKNVVQLQGTVEALDAQKKTFTLNGVKVFFGGNKVSFVGGAVADLVDGANVTVTGKQFFDGKVVKAQSIEFAQAPPVVVLDQVEGAIAGLDAAAKTFTVGTVTVDFSGTVTFVGVDAATLANGLNVLVKGTLSADGTKLAAQSIELVQP